MKTIYTDSPIEAARVIRAGGLVAFPTETVYGLGADLFDESAVQKIFQAKLRPSDNPLIVHIADRLQIDVIAGSVPKEARMLIDAFFPGPLTVVLERSPEVPLSATAGLETVGVRMPRNKTAHDFLAACGTPVVAPSANLSGRPSPTNWRAVAEDLDGRIECILKGDATEIGLESTVVDCTSQPLVVLRTGAVSLEDLKRIVPDVRKYEGDDSDKLRSPGMRHRHYSPTASVILLDTEARPRETESAGYIGINDRAESFRLKKLCASVADYARDVFEFFRECDRRQVLTIYCEVVPEEEGIGSALMDRLRRASLG